MAVIWDAYITHRVLTVDFRSLRSSVCWHTYSDYWLTWRVRYSVILSPGITVFLDWQGQTLGLELRDYCNMSWGYIPSSRGALRDEITAEIASFHCAPMLFYISLSVPVCIHSLFHHTCSTDMNKAGALLLVPYWASVTFVTLTHCR